ncbi:MAG: hypothetical protein CVU09_04720 [Bacteroidetes bacterium HGW-Bacteroidetes-4]|jgi:outer membrane lipoprotein-sorting protein|nr:MAG: hypothetical protein CVU09_04720 [Bacteroidetes bacterium HGW-Bacteroidetes-4]
MIKYLIISVFTLFVGTITAQKDPAAEALLKAMANKAQTYKSIDVEFEYTLENGQTNSKENYKGSVLIKGNKFKMQIDGTITFSDGKSRWVYLEESNEVNISAVIESDELEPEERFMNDPMSLYTLYEKGFKYTLSGTETVDGMNYNLIDLTPEDISKPYFKIRCWITPQDELNALKYFQKDGTRILLKFTSIKLDKKVKDSDFVFSPKDYPGVEVIDLRD